MGRLPDHARFQLTQEYVARAIAGELVLVPIRQRIGDLEDIYTMNAVATFTWDRLAEGRSVAEIAAALEEVFAADAGEIRRDMEEFLEQLLTIRAIRPIERLSDAPGPMPPG